MRPYRILSIGWIALCFFSGFVAFGQFAASRGLSGGKLTEDVLWSACAFLIYVLGIVASIFLAPGVTWSRIAVCIVAFFSVMFCGLALLDGGSPGWLTALLVFVVFYSMISITVLLIPKRYVA